MHASRTIFNENSVESIQYLFVGVFSRKQNRKRLQKGNIYNDFEVLELVMAASYASLKFSFSVVIYSGNPVP